MSVYHKDYTLLSLFSLNSFKISVNTQIDKVNDLLSTQNASELVEALMNASLGLKDVTRENADWYLRILQQARQDKAEVRGRYENIHHSAQ